MELSISKTDNLNDVQNTWKECRELSAAFISGLEHFIHQASACNEQFRYWSTFLDELIAVIIDLTLSFRESNWLLYLSALRSAMPLFFAFDQSKYSRWAPLYYNDCILLEERFPDLFDGFMNGDFTDKQRKQKCSAIPVDQALEKDITKMQKEKVVLLDLQERKKLQPSGILSNMKKCSISNSLTIFAIYQLTVNIHYIMNIHQLRLQKIGFM